VSTEPIIYRPVDFTEVLGAPMEWPQPSPCSVVFTGLSPSGLKLHDAAVVVSAWSPGARLSERTELCDAGLSFLRSISDGLTAADRWPARMPATIDGTANYKIEARNTGLSKVSLLVIPRLSLSSRERDADVWRLIAEDLNELFDAIRANVLNRDTPPVNLLDF
jgi:hypothetical protein